MPRVLRVLLVAVHAVLLGAALWRLDRWLSEDRQVGWERHAITGFETRWAAGHAAAKVAVFGSSTSVDWLPAQRLAHQFGVHPHEVLDAHINGCHQDCTYGSLRRVLPEAPRLQVAIFGTNLYQLCEDHHSKRGLQHYTLWPLEDLPRLFGLYRHAERPLEAVGRYAGNVLSGVYGDADAVQRKLRELTLGPRPSSKVAQRWIRREPPAKVPPYCDYSPDAVAFKIAVTGALLDDLGTIADTVYLLLLPDISLEAEAEDPATAAAWAAHRAAHRELAASRPFVQLIDLSRGGAGRHGDFTDGFHLSPRGIRRQQALLYRELRARGVTPRRPRP